MANREAPPGRTVRGAKDKAGAARRSSATTIPGIPDTPAAPCRWCPLVGCGFAVCRGERRMRLHHRLVRRRRWSNELDLLLAEGVSS